MSTGASSSDSISWDTESVEDVHRSFFLTEHQLAQLALHRLKAGGVDERIGAVVEE